MKTSNKLLVGLFAIVLIGMITANLILKTKLKNNAHIITNTEQVEQSDTTQQSGIKIEIKNTK